MGELLTTATLLLRLVLLIAEQSKERKQQDAGWMQAINSVLEQNHKFLAMADAERVAAEEAHAADPTDDAFLREFERTER